MWIFPSISDIQIYFPFAALIVPLYSVLALVISLKLVHFVTGGRVLGTFMRLFGG